MPTALQRAASAVLPLSLQRRRIRQATELILSNVNLYASVSGLHLADSGRRMVMELRAPVALPAATADALRRYLARKLHQTIGLRLDPERLYLVSLPPRDVASRDTPSSPSLRRQIKELPQWPDTAVGAPAPGSVAANDSALRSRALRPPALVARGAVRDAGDSPPPAFELPDDPRWTADAVQVQELSATDVANGFAATQPASELDMDMAGAARRAREVHGSG